MLRKGKVVILFTVSTVLLVLPLVWYNVTSFKYHPIPRPMELLRSDNIMTARLTASPSSSEISTGVHYNTTITENSLRITQPLTRSTPNPISRSRTSLIHVNWIEDFKKRGFALSNIPDKSQLWTKDVQLCIMFNLNRIKPNPNSINLLLAYYLPFFNHITLIFDGKWDKKPDYLPEYVKFFGCQSHIGWYMQKCMNLCLSQPSDSIKGYLFVADDMFVNLNKMKNLDLTKLWYIEPIVYKYSDLLTKDGRTLRSWWWWWGKPYHNERPLKAIVDSLSEEWKQKLVENAGFPDKFQIRCLSDLIYVPRSLAPSLTKVMTHVIHTADLFFEVAVPLSVGVVVHPSERVVLTNTYLWGPNRNANRIKQESAKKHFVHPVKLSKNVQAKLWRSLMEAQVKNANF